VLLLASCVTTRDLAHDPFPKIQAELRGVFNAMIEDVIAGDVQGLRVGHLNSDKFTKFDVGTGPGLVADDMAVKEKTIADMLTQVRHF
jgi:hypothetical protein